MTEERLEVVCQEAYMRGIADENLKSSAAEQPPDFGRTSLIYRE